MFNRKNASGKVVCTRHELPLQPRMALFKEYEDPKGGDGKLERDTVIEFHKLPEFQQVTLKVPALGRTGQAVPHQRGRNGGLNTG